MSEQQTIDGKARILIVEDDLNLADVYSTKFEKEGFEVFVAADGEEGLSKINEWRPHLVLLDIMLPKKDGFAVLKELKENPQTKMIPVIMWTNLSDPEESRKAKELGAIDYLVKVYNMPSEVVDTVQKRLNL